MNYLNPKLFNKEHHTSTPWLIAILVAIIFHGLLAVLFIPEDYTKKTTDEKLPSIIMLPIGSNDILPTQKSIVYWMEDSNPTLIVQPNRVYGYSSVLDNKHAIHLNQNYPELSNIVNTMPIHNSIVEPIPIKRASIAKLISQVDLAQTPLIPKGIFNKIKLSSLQYPLFSDYYTGKVFHFKFKNTVIINNIINKYNPTKPTVLLVNVSIMKEIYPTVRIISSCGYPKLDEEAVKLITIELTTKNKKLLNKQLKMNIEWKQEF